ncbi:hypothetical protein G6O67_008225 [Ophiocordyceps sinensis]|uniref:Uncharacterized protein n=1 Tax=Ophiocordyceps sinensis TaxID=72228 RepID=A0A8H4PJZ4_9HYPO|nr:hypothetical protein G6O67_008225 [Ophiocordyceps sinensis]
MRLPCVRLVDDDAPFPRDERRVDNVDVGVAKRRHQPLDQSGVERLGVGHAGKIAVVDQLEPAAADHAHLASCKVLRVQATHLLHQLDRRLQLSILARQDDGGVDGTRGRSASEDLEHLGAHVHGHVLLCFHRRRSQMRCRHDLGMPGKPLRRRVGSWRLRCEDVQPGSGDAALVEGLEESSFVVHTAARNIEDARRLLHGPQLRLANQIHGRGQEGRVNGEEVGVGKQAPECRHQLDAGLPSHVCAGIGVDGLDLHAQPLCHPGHVEADLAQANDAEGLLTHLDADELAALPPAVFDAGVCSTDVAGRGEEEGYCVLGGAENVARGRVDDDDALVGGGGHVNVVDADAGTGDDLELPACLEHLGGDGGLGPHNEAMVARDYGLELGRRQARLVMDVEVGGQQGEAVLRDLFGDEDAATGGGGAGRDGAHCRRSHCAGCNSYGLGTLDKMAVVGVVGDTKVGGYQLGTVGEASQDKGRQRGFM